MSEIKGKLFQILSSFSKIEQKQLAVYLPIYLQGSLKESVLMFHHILDFYEKHDAFPDNDHLIQLLTTEEKYTDQDIRLFKSYLLKAIEQAVVSMELQKDERFKHLLLFKAFNQRGLQTAAEKTYALAKNQLENSPIRNSDFFEIMYKLEDENYRSRQNKRRTDEDFITYSGSLDKHFLSERFRIASLEENYRGIFGKSFENSILPFLLDYVTNYPQILEEPAVGIYYYCYMCGLHPEEESWFEQLYLYILKHLEYFPKEEQRDIILFANNFCIRRINKGETPYLEKSFALYRIGINSGALLEKGHLSRYTYKNVVTLGLRLKQHKWTQAFLDENKNLLEKKYQEGSYAYNKANIKYDLNKYDEAVELLNKADQDDVFIFLASKNLLIKIYYELDYIDSLEYLMGSLLVYLKRKNIEKIYKDNYTNLTIMVRKLLSLQRLTASQRTTLNSRKRNVRKAIQSTTTLTEKKWLLEKLDQIA